MCAQTLAYIIVSKTELTCSCNAGRCNVCKFTLVLLLQVLWERKTHPDCFHFLKYFHLIYLKEKCGNISNKYKQQHKKNWKKKKKTQNKKPKKNPQLNTPLPQKIWTPHTYKIIKDKLHYLVMSSLLQVHFDSRFSKCSFNVYLCSKIWVSEK